jgi:hypothetical protein
VSSLTVLQLTHPATRRGSRAGAEGREGDCREQAARREGRYRSLTLQRQPLGELSGDDRVADLQTSEDQGEGSSLRTLLTQKSSPPPSLVSSVVDRAALIEPGIYRNEISDQGKLQTGDIANMQRTRSRTYV